MDSKLQASAVIISIVMITFILAMVFYVNKKEEQPAPVEEQVVIDNPEQGLRDFLKDETFFDEKPQQSYAVFKGDTLPKLFMTACSVYRDIRVTVTDEAGQPFRDNELFINLDGRGQYKDVDRDGVIIIPDITAGDYYVSMEGIAGYVTPTEPMRVAVKEHLEYKVIDDISMYIFSEDDIDVSQEDTEVNEAFQDADETESTEIKRADNTSFGIDVSKYQGDIDWARVKASGVSFAIIRAAYRGSKTGAIVEDPYFKRNIEGAKAAGIQVGIYFFTQAVSETEAVEEASVCVSLVQDYGIDYPIFIDTEGAGGTGRADGLDVATRTLVCKAFCKTVESAGYHAGIYASRNWYYNKLNASELEDFVIWDAEYTGAPKYTGRYDLWQYTSSGMIDGIGTKVDLDISYIEIN